MLHASPGVMASLPADKKKYFTNTSQFIGKSQLSWTGSNSAANLASRPIRLLVMDEVDKFPDETKGEASAVNLTAYPALERLYDDILAGNRAAVRLTVAMLAAAKKVQVSEAAAILAHLDETVPDPNWPAEVPGVCRIMALGNGGFADYAQINKVLGRG
jgi:hypothetical protein